jgi:hypothetical protein
MEANAVGGGLTAAPNDFPGSDQVTLASYENVTVSGTFSGANPCSSRVNPGRKSGSRESGFRLWAGGGSKGAPTACGASSVLSVHGLALPGELRIPRLREGRLWRENGSWLRPEAALHYRARPSVYRPGGAPTVYRVLVTPSITRVPGGSSS